MSPLITPAYEKARALLGSTPDEIHQKFAAIQEMNFSQGDAKLIISRLSDRELADIAALYRQSATAGENGLLRIMAQKLDATSLVRVAKAFGNVATKQAVHTYSSDKVRQDFSRQLLMSPSVAPMASGSPPSTNSTTQEIYLDYRTAPVGNTSPSAAVVEAGIFLGANSLVGTAADGWLVGTGFYWLISTYDPAMDDVIGGTVYSAIQNIDDATTELDQGQDEQAFDSLFEAPVAGTGDYSGDWNVGESYEDYEQGTGCD